MAEFSPLDAALFAFRKRDKRFVLTAASVAYLLGTLLIAAIVVAGAWGQLEPLMGWYFDVMRSASSGVEPPDPPMPQLFGLLPWYGLSLLLGLIWFAAYEAACLRWMVRGERGGLLGFSFGADTWRVLAVYLVWFVLVIGVVAAVTALYLALNAFSGLGAAAQIVAMVLGALAPLAVCALVIWGAVRLSPAAAASIAARRFAFGQAWSATRGRFWPLLGAFVILAGGYLGFSLLISVLRLPLAHAMYPVMREAMGSGDMGAVFTALGESFASPLVIAIIALYVLASMALACVLYVCWFGVNARAAQAALEDGTIRSAG